MGLHELNEMLYRFDDLKKGTFASRMQAKELALDNFRNVLFEAIELSQPKEKPKRTIADHYPAGGSPEPCSFCEKFGEIEEKKDKYEATLEKIQQWAKAYPLESFPEPDFKVVAKILKNNNLSLDEVSASNMRYVITQVLSIVDEALKEK